MNTPNSQAAPAAGRDWNPAAALERLAANDLEGLRVRLQRAAEAYAQAPKGHLSFEAMQGVVAGDSRLLEQHAPHLDACEYCATLRESMTTAAAPARAFDELVRIYERAPQTIATPARPRATRGRLSEWLDNWRSLAAVAGGLLVAFLLGSAFQARHALVNYHAVLTASSAQNAGVVRIQVPDIQTDWRDVSANCAQQSGEKQSCDLLASAAQLQLVSLHMPSQPARPVVAAALRSSGVSPAVVKHVEGALDTPATSNAKLRERLLTLEASVVAQERNPSLYLELAKLRFANGDTLKGFESISSYVATDNAAAGKAMLVGFVEPIKTVDARRPKTFDLTPEHGGGSTKPTLSQPQKDVVIVATEEDHASADSAGGRND